MTWTSRAFQSDHQVTKQSLRLLIEYKGRYLASGQLGTIYSKTNDAPVILWDLKQFKPLNVFKGLKGSVTLVAFSPDEAFLAAVGENNYFMIWNAVNYNVVSSKISENRPIIGIP